MRAPAGSAGRAAALLAAGLAAYALYWVLFIVQPQIYRVSFLLVALVLTFLLFPAFAKASTSRPLLDAGRPLPLILLLRSFASSSSKPSRARSKSSPSPRLTDPNVPGRFGWFWECPNGENCQYRHALPPGFMLKSQRKAAEDAEKANTISLEEFLEVEVSPPLLPHNAPLPGFLAALALSAVKLN